MATTRLSDTMIRTMLAALAHQGSDGRYQVLTRGSTRTALETRGMVEVEETHDEHGRPVGHHYLTPNALATLRNGFVLMMGNPDSKATEWHRAAIRSNTRISRAAASLILGDIAGAKVITRTPGLAPTTEDMTAEQATVTLSLLLTKGQRIEEYGTGPQGDEPPTRLLAHTGDGFPREYEFILTHWGPAEEPTAAPAPRPAAEVLAADPIPADTSVWEGMPGEQTGPGGLSTVDALTAEEYAVQVRSGRVWVLPNHDDGAHMTRAQVISAMARVRRNSADHVRTAIDTDGTLYLSNGHQAARYIPVTLFADYSAESCPGCDTPYAVNGDGPCPGKRPADAPASRSMAGLPNSVCKAAEDIKAAYNAEAAELLGEAERFERQWRAEEDSAVIIIDRAEALALVVKALREDWITGVRDGAVSLVTPGTASYLLVPIPEEEARPCPTCGVEPGQPCKDPLLVLFGDTDEEAPQAPAAEEQHDRPADDVEQATALLAQVGEAARYRHAVRIDGESSRSTHDRAATLAIIATELRQGARASWFGDASETLVLRYHGVDMRITAVGKEDRPAAQEAEERPQVDPEAIRAQVIAEAEGKPCQGCDAPAGEPCEPMGMCEEAREQAVTARVDEAVNLAVRFLPQDPADENTRPCVEVGTVQVYAYRDGGRLVVSVDLDGVDTEGPETDDEGLVPMVITVQGETVYEV